MSEQDAEKESWIRRRAYQLWQEAGETHGRHEDDWNQAGREYDQAMGTPAATPETSGDLKHDTIETPPSAGDATGGTPKPRDSATATIASEPGKA